MCNTSQGGHDQSRCAIRKKKNSYQRVTVIHDLTETENAAGSPHVPLQPMNSGTSVKRDVPSQDKCLQQRGKNGKKSTAHAKRERERERERERKMQTEVVQNKGVCLIL